MEHCLQFRRDCRFFRNHGLESPDDVVKVGLIAACSLTLLKERAGLSWEGVATCIGVDHRQLLHWRKKGAEPSGVAMLALVALAEQVPGGLDILMGRDLGVMAQGRE